MPAARKKKLHMLCNHLCRCRSCAGKWLHITKEGLHPHLHYTAPSSILCAAAGARPVFTRCILLGREGAACQLAEAAREARQPPYGSRPEGNGGRRIGTGTNQHFALLRCPITERHMLAQSIASFRHRRAFPVFWRRLNLNSMCLIGTF